MASSAAEGGKAVHPTMPMRPGDLLSTPGGAKLKALIGGKALLVLGSDTSLVAGLERLDRRGSSVPLFDLRRGAVRVQVPPGTSGAVLRTRHARLHLNEGLLVVEASADRTLTLLLSGHAHVEGAGIARSEMPSSVALIFRAGSLVHSDDLASSRARARLLLDTRIAHRVAVPDQDPLRDLVQPLARKLDLGGDLLLPTPEPEPEPEPKADRPGYHEHEGSSVVITQTWTDERRRRELAEQEEKVDSTPPGGSGCNSGIGNGSEGCNPGNSPDNDEDPDNQPPKGGSGCNSGIGNGSEGCNPGNSPDNDEDPDNRPPKGGSGCNSGIGNGGEGCNPGNAPDNDGDVLELQLPAAVPEGITHELTSPSPSPGFSLEEQRLERIRRAWELRGER